MEDGRNFGSIICGNLYAQFYIKWESHPIQIGKGSWIGAHTTLVIGAKVGKGTLIAANSVLNIVIEDFSLYGGVPAKFIKKVC
jgi:maltose O-acetyltransferase